MFNIKVEYPSFEEEVDIVKQTTSNRDVQLNEILTGTDIMEIQDLIRKIPVVDNVLTYAVELATKTRPDSDKAPDFVKNYLSWGAGPRASQYLVLGAKAHAAINGKYSPDQEDVRAVAPSILRHRIVKNYKAEAEGLDVDDIVNRLF
jgi:MoxR-like ATPase